MMTTPSPSTQLYHVVPKAWYDAKLKEKAKESANFSSVTVPLLLSQSDNVLDMTPYVDEDFPMIFSRKKIAERGSELQLVANLDGVYKGPSVELKSRRFPDIPFLNSSSNQLRRGASM